MDPFEKPPAHLRDVFKTYRSTAETSKDPHVLDLRVVSTDILKTTGWISSTAIISACTELENGRPSTYGELRGVVEADKPILEHPDVPGLLMVPDLVPPQAQISLTDRLLHDELSNPQHKTNIHFHHTLPYSPGRSFFERPPDSGQCAPLDPATHKPISTDTLLSRKLRWITLGGQYDWTNKRYPDGEPPRFPRGIGRFVETLFPQMKAQAAIVNLYSPGDVLSMHRDGAEESERGLVSISLGCDALFVVGLESANPAVESSPLVVRLRSGDAVFMTGESRHAWHGVPKIVQNTCPEFLKDWPGNQEGFEHWRGWMRDKRINLNVRQMWD